MCNSSIPLVTATISTGAFFGNAVISAISGLPQQSLVQGASITALAVVIGVVVAQILRSLYIIKSNGEQAAYALMSAGITYITLVSAAMIGGLIPGGVLGIAALVTSVATSLFSSGLWILCIWSPL